jgi:hypothetical protein
LARRFAWVLNLDAEYELARGGPGYTPSRKLLSQLELFGASSRALLHPEDRLLGESAALASFDPRSFVGRAWCPTPRAVERFKAFGITPEPHPPVDVLRRVNHRRFAHELGGGLPDQRYVEHRSDLESQLRSGRSLLRSPAAASSAPTPSERCATRSKTGSTHPSRRTA